MKLSSVAAALLLTLATPVFSVPLERRAAESSGDSSVPTTSAAVSATSAASSSSAPVASATPADSELASWIDEETTFSQNGILANINPEGSVTGFITASPSKDSPDYFYSWTRDSALTIRSVLHMYNTSPSDDLVAVLKDFVTFQINAMNTDTVCDCLGEPKFNADGSSYTGAWGRPQNDGPAERATAMILIANALNDNSSYVEDTLTPAIKQDLDYVVETWDQTCYDLWEEVNGLHFFTLMVMRRALIDGASFLSDDSYTSTAQEIETKLDSFYGDKDYIEVTQQLSGGADYKSSGLDTSTLIAANVAGLGDGIYTPGSDKILATSLAIKEVFSDLYAINADSNSTGLSYAIGRYPEDKYDGLGTSEANPWFLCTLAFAELYYRAIDEWKSAGSIEVTDASAAFFQQFDSSAVSGTSYTADSDDFNSIVQAVAAEADTYFARVQKHASDNTMSEQIDRDSGEEVGAKDLTWSYAAFVTAAAAYNGSPSA
ncbi:glucoamylase [Zychaea mexicana]|uniref:glucoamylase n=1 Tax=Zychaea mexicana TaxID=64656 RepID=UPI0022FEADA0|nr:glucoamylase [Zychaea mexicana]KAI9489050.1 glucoamylase [Zychaea mexicana]